MQYNHLMVKTCSQCKVEKKLDGFHRSKIFSDGRTSKCKECKSGICKTYYVNNADHCKKGSTNYYYDNKSKRNAWERNKSMVDPLFKLKKRLRHRLCSAFHRLKTSKMSGSSVKDLGCTVEYCKQYLESKFEPGMTWDNWTNNGWHIDHIVPLSSADTEEKLIELCHYTNLQPLWAKDNISKGNKVQ